MKHKASKILLLGLLLATASFPSLAMQAVQLGVTDLVMSSLKTATGNIAKEISVLAVGWLGAFILAQFTWTHINLLIGGADFEKVWAKFLGGLFWFGICVWVIKNGGGFIANVSEQLLTKATGLSGSAFSPAAPIELGIVMTASMLEQLDSTSSALGLLNPFPSIMLGVVSVVILIISAVIAFKIFMIFIETKIVIALAPLSFALLGLNSFRDQGMAPFKYLVALAFRVFIIAAILAAMSAVSTEIINSFKTLPAMNDPSVWPPLFAVVIGYGLLGALALRSDSIAAMLASGSSNMGPGDAAAVAATVGAAAAVATGGATSAAGVVDKAMETAKAAGGKTMSEVIDKIKGGAGASQEGTGTGGAEKAIEKAVGPAPAMKPKSDASASLAEAKLATMQHVGQPGFNAGRPSTMAERPSLAERKALMAGGEVQTSTPSSSTGAAKSAIPESAAAAAPAGGTGSDAAPSKANGEDASPSGSGTSAGIEGNGKNALADKEKGIEKNLDANKTPGFVDSLKSLNDHVCWRAFKTDHPCALNIDQG